MPQLVLSVLYFSTNALYTSMLASYEWSHFSRRKPLRVTSPRGAQRSTYTLQLPYRYAIPLLAVSSLLHWLLSQSLFFVRVLVQLPFADGVEWPLSTCGYSAIAIICTLILATLLVAATVMTGLRRLDPGVPLAATCSAAISAACHGPLMEEEPELKPIMWGVVRDWDGDRARERGIEMNNGEEGAGHCAFSINEVEAPVVGAKYAGRRYYY